MSGIGVNLSDFLNPDVLAGAGGLAEEFRQAEPFRHIVIDDFLSDEYCQRLIDEFPDFDEKLAINEDGLAGAKAVHQEIRQLGPAYCSLDELSRSEVFRELIGEITGVDELQHDPRYIGGGTHENLDGQNLEAHVDFNYHPVTSLHRRLNLIVYLNPEWDDNWGGSLQLHRDPYLLPSQDEIKLVTPLANRCVMFETTEHSWHGFKRIVLPEDKKDLSRRSFALYYYTDSRPPEETGLKHSTIYVGEHLPEWYAEGMTLDAAELQHISSMVTSRDQHIKRLYGNIMRLNQQIQTSGEHLSLVQGRNERLVQQLEQPQCNRCAAMEASHSWRITAPLRALKKALLRN